MKAVAVLLVGLVALGACSRFDHVGRAPTMTPIGEGLDPRQVVTPARVAVATPDPEPQRFSYQQASLFGTGQQALVGDRRANKRGDILTIVIDIDDRAEFRNQTERSRQGTENMSVEALLGLNRTIERALPTSGTLNPGVAATGRSQSRGQGSTRRNERLSTRVAATVIDVLPNGHLVIQGDQEVRLNYELRDVRITGIVRPEDINRRNEVSYERIAGARIAYGGRGQIMDMQQPRLGQQITDILMPF